MSERGASVPVRAFVALDLDPSSLRRIGRVSDRLRMGSGAPSATWAPILKMHVTLRFLGDVTADDVVSVGRELRPLAEGQPPPPPCPFRLEAFPSTQEARIVVAELLDEGGALATLAAKVAKVAPTLGETDDRPYRPHVTLARLKRAYDARKWLRPELAEGIAPCRMTHLTLYRSHLQPEGSTYVPLARFAFAAE